MTESDLTEFEIEEEGLKLRICRGSKNQGTLLAAQQMVPAMQHTPLVSQALSAPVVAEQNVPGKVIKSPMVGVFYRAPSPQSPLFVNIGDVVKPESVVCIIETMKMMNEIQAEESGTIVEILVENGQGVEFGQPLFRQK